MKRIAARPYNAAARRARARIAHTIHAFFIRQAPKIIGQVVALRGKQSFVKAELSQDEIDQIDAIVAGIDFIGWASLAGDVEPEIVEAVKAGGYDALRLIGLDVTADADVFNVVNTAAVDYAAERSAQMIGMRRLPDGTLVENPDAFWQITDSTRDMIRGDISQALQEGWTNDQLAAKLSDNYAFSSDRAMVIARTETIRASNSGSLSAAVASGIILKKEWTTAGDDKVDDGDGTGPCEINEEKGPIPLDEDFPSGDDAPPAHPNCRCTLVYYTELDVPQTAQPEEQAA